ncbi:MAG: YncE family protein [Candidatus Acidiferrales bacterium]
MFKIPVNCRKILFAVASLAGCLAFCALAVNAAPPLKAGAPILLPGTNGGFDFIHVDASANRLLLDQEKGNQAFDVFDLSSRMLVKRVPTGTTQDVSVDLKRDLYYVSGNDPGRLLIISRKTLDIVGTMPLPTPTNLNAYDPASGMLYETSDTTPRIWVIDPASKKTVATIDLTGTGMQGIVFDPPHKWLYQAVKSAGTVTAIDPSTNTISHVWTLDSCATPHGIAMVPEGNGLLVTCNGSLVLMDRSSGKILSRAETAPNVDEVAYDEGLHLAYCASKDGEISVVRVAGEKLTALGSVPDEKTTHSITVDPKTHTVWIAYAKGDES